jgi:hypothetical protein
MGSRRRIVAFALVVTALVGSAPASAQPDAQIAAAKQAFKEGDEAEKRRDLPTAAAKFKEAIAVKETPQLVLRLGGVQEKMGLLAQAMASYERGMERAQAANLSNVAKVAREQMEAMRSRVPTVVVTVAKAYPELTVTLDDKPLALGTKIYLDPGDHKVVAEATGYQKKEKPFAAVERDSLEFQLDLAPVGGPAPVTGPIEGNGVTPDNGPRPSKVPAAILIGGGAAAIGAGVAFFVVATGKNSDVDKLCGGPDRKHCPVTKKDEINSDISTVKLFQIVSLVSTVVGVGGVGVGTYLLLRKPPPPAQAADGVRVFPILGPTTAGAGLSGRF